MHAWLWICVCLAQHQLLLQKEATNFTEICWRTKDGQQQELDCISVSTTDKMQLQLPMHANANVMLKQVIIAVA